MRDCVVVFAGSRLKSSSHRPMEQKLTGRWSDGKAAVGYLYPGPNGQYGGTPYGERLRGWNRRVAQPTAPAGSWLQTDWRYYLTCSCFRRYVMTGDAAKTGSARNRLLEAAGPPAPIETHAGRFTVQQQHDPCIASCYMTARHAASGRSRSSGPAAVATTEALLAAHLGRHVRATGPRHAQRAPDAAHWKAVQGDGQGKLPTMIDIVRFPVAALAAPRGSALQPYPTDVNVGPRQDSRRHLQKATSSGPGSLAPKRAPASRRHTGYCRAHNGRQAQAVADVKGVCWLTRCSRDDATTAPCRNAPAARHPPHAPLVPL